ncbi:hypothetical protein Bca52824_085252 [Brassica carinata]|uniref:F-box domain-containing protein n=1 Tax=Brassica carinata TaxID=52824 RepID=A0A8X7TL37_BRACI|nr:hypothetical protein Bca52824_085252 [Brassica carinata]
MKRVKRSEKPDERNVNDPFKKLPNDMNVVILMKLPPGSIARLHFASKHLSSIILDKKFTELYMTRSSTQPRHLVSVHGGRQYVKMQRFHSISQEYPLSSNHDKVSCKPDPYGPYLPYEFTPPVRGLICGRNGTKVKVGNPSTVNDVYKVLCMTVVSKRSNISRGVAPCDAMSEEHQVITLPEDIPCVVNYTGKVAITSWPTRNDLIDIHHGYRFRGTLSTGELIFSPWTLPINPLYFISYNLKENIAKKVVVEELEEPYASREVYFDHVESPMFCQIMLHEDVRLVKEFCHYSGMIALTSQSDNN